jgi:hypothetical protein
MIIPVDDLDLKFPRDFRRKRPENLSQIDTIFQIEKTPS